MSISLCNHVSQNTRIWKCVYAALKSSECTGEALWTEFSVSKLLRITRTFISEAQVCIVLLYVDGAYG
jgi:hypothetical protein